MGDEHATDEPLPYGGSRLCEGGCSEDRRGREPVDSRCTDVAAWVDEGTERFGDRAVDAHMDDGNFDDPIPGRGVAVRIGDCPPRGRARVARTGGADYQVDVRAAYGPCFPELSGLMVSG